VHRGFCHRIVVLPTESCEQHQRPSLQRRQMGESENEVSERGGCGSVDEFEDRASENNGESDNDASKLGGCTYESEDRASELGGLAKSLLGFGPTPPQTLQLHRRLPTALISATTTTTMTTTTMINMNILHSRRLTHKYVHLRTHAHMSRGRHLLSTGSCSCLLPTLERLVHRLLPRSDSCSLLARHLLLS
jgi:hypothetical protein